jgi:ribose 5-phosphate isomerase A
VESDLEREKQVAAEAAALLVPAGATVGLGTGSTVRYLLPALGARQLDLMCVATSPATEALAGASGLRVIPFEGIDKLDVAIDGADQVDPAGWLVKGGGGAHTREKVVAAAADRFVVIVSSNKMVRALRPPVPLELLAFGLPATLRALSQVQLRPGAPPTPDGGVLADYVGAVEDPAELAAQLAGIPGVVSHGLFPPTMVWQVMIGRGRAIEIVRPGA